MNRFIQARTDLALRALIQNSLEAQDLTKDLRQRMDWISYLKEICQVRLTGPRRSGHTTSALRVCGEMFDKPLFVALTHSMGALHRDNAERMGIHNFTFTSRKSFDNDARGRRHDAIVVDPAFGMKTSLYEELFSIGSCYAPNYDEFCIILMQ